MQQTLIQQANQEEQLRKEKTIVIEKRNKERFEPPTRSIKTKSVQSVHRQKNDLIE